jgi:oxygen-independent coproporphyrinogen-3 oxidase
MAGIYLHIPFCKQACHYCNFHFSTSLKYKSDMVAAIVQELEMQKNYLGNAPLDSVYFGGGTPSLLSGEDLDLIFAKINELYVLSPKAEITLEANPDDLTNEKLEIFKNSPINRLSIGIQSFSDADLKYMNRAHNADEAANCIQRAQFYGFTNLTVDLIYGTPTMNDAQWQENIEQVLALDVPHISCYALTVEPKTALEHFIKKGKSKPVDEEQTARQFEYLTARLKKAGFEHYEISNFAKPGMYARHNSNYWSGQNYLGVGPSAHSFNGKSRQWNVANNAKYMEGMKAEKLPFEREELTADQRYNEYILTTLRTMWGVDFNKISNSFHAHFLENVQPFLDNETVIKRKNKYCLTEKGKLLADNISMELFA